MDPATKALARGTARLRRRRGLTMSELAEATDMSIQFLSMLERGERSASLETVAKIAKALSVTPSELFAEGETAKPRDTTRGEEVAVLLEDLSDEQARRVVGIVREVRDLVTGRPRKSRRGRGS